MKIKFKLKGQDKKFSRYIINPEANLEIAEILNYLLKVYHDYGWSFIEKQNQCSFMCSNFYNLVKELEPELFKELKTKYPPGLQVAHGLFRSGEKGTYRMIHSWVKLGPVIVDPTYKQFFKNGRVDKFDDMIKRYERKPFILNPDDFYGFEMGTEKAEFLLKKLREKFKKPNYTYKNFKSMHLFSWEVDQIINEFNLKGQDEKFSRYIINPEANLEIAEILNYLLKVYHDYGWSFIEKQNQCSFMCSNFYNLVKELEPELFKELKTKYPPGLQVAHGLFRSGEKGTYRMIHSWVKLGPVIVDPTYKQFFKDGRVDKFDDMVKRYERKPSILNPDTFYGFEMGTEKAEFILKELRKKFKKPNYTYQDFKSMYFGVSLEVDRIIKEFNLKGQDSRIYSGEEVANYFREITEIDETITGIGLESLIKQYVIPNQFELKDISIDEVLKDPDFEYFWSRIESGESDLYDKYYDTNFEDWELEQPIILYQDNNKTFLVDGYHRTAQHLLNEEYTIKAYINVKE